MPDLSALAADWERVRPVIAAHARFPLGFQAAELAQLQRGEAVRRREPVAGTERVVAAVWTAAPRDALWVAIQDEAHFVMVEGLVEEVLPASTPTSKLLYQRIDLPWPVADRQWVIDIRNNRTLHENSAGRAWERAWDLSSARGSRLEMPDAVWAPVNAGGWMLVEAAGGTLLIYHVRTSIGGNVPESAVNAWSASSVKSMLDAVIERSSKLSGHYGATHTVVFRPDGTPVPPIGGK